MTTDESRLGTGIPETEWMNDESEVKSEDGLEQSVFPINRWLTEFLPNAVRSCTGSSKSNVKCRKIDMFFEQ